MVRHPRRRHDASDRVLRGAHRRGARSPPGRSGKETAIFPAADGGAAGCLFAAPEDQPSHFGSRVYFDAGPSIDEWLARVEPAGGRILVPKTEITGGRGVYAYIEDSEGNRIGLNAPD